VLIYSSQPTFDNVHVTGAALANKNISSEQLTTKMAASANLH